MKRFCGFLTLILALGMSQPVSAQWSLTWGTNAAPACQTTALSTMCFSAQLDYAADGYATFSFWNRENFVPNARGIVDNLAFSGITAPDSTWFKLNGVANAAWSYGTPPLGNLGVWGWGVSGGGITDTPSSAGGPAAKKTATVWGGSFGSGGAAVFSLFIGVGRSIPVEAVLSLHIRDAYQDASGGWQSDRLHCASNDVFGDCIDDDPDTPQEVVPEPATMTLLATGLAGLAAANRRRRKQQQD